MNLMLEIRKINFKKIFQNPRLHGMKRLKCKMINNLQQFIFTVFLHFQGESLFAALGGALSFYLGVAIVIGFEVLELIILVFASVWSHQSQPKKHAP